MSVPFPCMCPPSQSLLSEVNSYTSGGRTENVGGTMKGRAFLLAMLVNSLIGAVAVAQEAK